jgi:hypothetical protein
MALTSAKLWTGLSFLKQQGEPMALTSQLSLLGWLVDDFGLVIAVNISCVIVHVMGQISRRLRRVGNQHWW